MPAAKSQRFTPWLAGPLSFPFSLVSKCSSIVFLLDLVLFRFDSSQCDYPPLASDRKNPAPRYLLVGWRNPSFPSFAREAPSIENSVLLVSPLLSRDKGEIPKIFSTIAGTSPGIFSLSSERLSLTPGAPGPI